MASDETWMRIALREARRGAGRTSPNPAVGAVIVSARGRLLSKGWHRGAGRPHAEIEAIRGLSRPALARGATLYVTLEPCSTRGRTPPCVDAIIAAGFSRVVVGAIDPNPAHTGRALDLLRKAAIEVTSGILEAETREINRAFNKWIRTGMPFVIAKCALSLDGRITRLPREGPWLTNERSRLAAHRLRAQVDAILIGAGTLRVDNPRLTVRGVRATRQPLRVVLTRSGDLPGDAHLFTDEHRQSTVVYRRRSLAAVLRDLGSRGVTSVLIEGGSDILTQAFRQRLVDHAQFHVAPLFLGGPKLCIAGTRKAGEFDLARIIRPVCRRLGDDLILSGDVET